MKYMILQNKFKRTSTRVNPILIRKMGLDFDSIKKIENLQRIRGYFFNIIEISDDFSEIKRISNIVTQINFQLQKLWKFDQDENMHRWFDIPKCSCPKLDNEESLGTPSRIIDPNCIIHN